MSEEDSTRLEKSLLVIIFDTNPNQLVYLNNPECYMQVLNSVIAFSNAHLMQKVDNMLAMLACYGNNSEFIYPTKEKLNVRQIDGQYEIFTMVNRTIKDKLYKTFNELQTNSNNHDSLISGALSMALCYINRILSSNQLLTVKMNSRILIITGSNDSIREYMNYMNIFFTCQKKQILIDVCTLNQNCNLFQQGCDITNGNYLKITQINGLLQYLLWVFLPESPLRQKLVLPPKVKVDYRAACFCHRQLIDIGYVCSVCLSIFCKFSPICTTCHTVFKIPTPIGVKPKKKKIKL